MEVGFVGPPLTLFLGPIKEGCAAAHFLGTGPTALRRPTMTLMWFHLMPYTRLPDDFRQKHNSVWVDIGHHRAAADADVAAIPRPSRAVDDVAAGDL
jgi:hypothetical protein